MLLASQLKKSHFTEVLWKMFSVIICVVLSTSWGFCFILNHGLYIQVLIGLLGVLVPVTQTNVLSPADQPDAHYSPFTASDNALKTASHQL